MRTADIDWDRYGQHTRAMDAVLRLCADLTKRFKNRDAPMPIVVLRAERPQERPGQPRAPEPDELEGHPVDALVDVLHDIYRDGRLRCERLPVRAGQRAAKPRRRSPLPYPDADQLREWDDALEMVGILSTPGGWENARSSPCRPFSFPRSRLLGTIERAVSDSMPGCGPPDQEAAFSRLGRTRREEPAKGALTALRGLLAFSMPLISLVLTVELTELSTPVRAPWLLGTMVAVILVAWVVLLYQQSFTAPLSWFYPASFPSDWNYFGLSATNAEEAQALTAEFAGHGDGTKYAVVLERVGDNGTQTDPYTQQQAEGATTALHGAGFRLAGGGPISYTPKSDLTNSGSVLQAICNVEPSVVYLAGRHQDLSQLVSLLQSHRNCFADRVTVLSGDDMTAIEYPHTTVGGPLAPQMTLYYVAQTNPAYLGHNDNDSHLNGALGTALNLATIPGYSNPVFADGLLALGFDAAAVLYNASTVTELGEEPLPRAAVIPGLRCPEQAVMPREPVLSDGATGPLGFVDVQHGLDFFEAVSNGSGSQDVTYKTHWPTNLGMCLPNIAPDG